MEGQNKSQKNFFGKTSFFRFLMFSSASALLFCAGSFVPPLGMAALLFSPTPLVLLGAREGKKWMTAGIFFASGLLALLFGPLFSLYYLLGQGLLCFGLILPLGRVKNGSEALFFCMGVAIASKVVFMASVVSMTGQNPFMLNPDALRDMVSQMYSGVLSRGGMDAATFNESMEQVVSFVPYMLPSLILMSSALDSFLNYKLCEFLQRKQAVVFPALPPFGEWRFPKSLLWALVFAFILPLALDTEGEPLLTMLEVNLKFLVNVFFFLQGMSFVWWWLLKRKMHFLLRIMILALLSLPVLGMWAIALGVGDMCLDLRAKLKNYTELKK